MEWLLQSALEGCPAVLSCCEKGRRDASGKAPPMLNNY